MPTLQLADLSQAVKGGEVTEPTEPTVLERVTDLHRARLRADPNISADAAKLVDELQALLKRDGGWREPGDE